MWTRRNFIRQAIAAMVGLGLTANPFGFFLGKARAQGKKVKVSKDIKWTELRHWNPKDLDTSELEITPLNEFRTMGLDDFTPDLEKWRLVVDGHVEKPLSLTYEEVLSMPSIERPVLLICPGFFVNHGLWKGVYMKHLLESAAAKRGVTHVTFMGPEGNYEKTMRVPVQDALSDKAFVAYRVNGERLPAKHGFPLRLVAEGYYGTDWVKYVYKITIDMIPT